MTSSFCGVFDSGVISLRSVRVANRYKDFHALYTIQEKQCELAKDRVCRSFEKGMDLVCCPKGTFVDMRWSRSSWTGSSANADVPSLKNSRQTRSAGPGSQGSQGDEIPIKKISYDDLSFDIRPGLSDDSKGGLGTSDLESDSDLTE
jgi:hypothetical protein